MPSKETIQDRKKYTSLDIHPWLLKNLFALYKPAVTHIPYFGDATKSPTGDAASPAGDVDVSRGMYISKGDDTSPVGNDRIS
jgi:hypothetical protein